MSWQCAVPNKSRQPWSYRAVWLACCHIGLHPRGSIYIVLISVCRREATISKGATATRVLARKGRCQVVGVAIQCLLRLCFQSERRLQCPHFSRMKSCNLDILLLSPLYNHHQLETTTAWAPCDSRISLLGNTSIISCLSLWQFASQLPFKVPRKQLNLSLVQRQAWHLAAWIKKNEICAGGRPISRHISINYFVWHGDCIVNEVRVGLTCDVG